MDIIGNIYKKHSKTLDKDFYLVVLGYVKRNVEYRFIKGVKEYDVTPYIFIDKQKISNLSCVKLFRLNFNSIR